MDATNISFRVRTHSGFRHVYDIDPEIDMTGWQVASLVFDPDAPEVALALMTLAVDTSAKTITVDLSPTVIAGMLPNGADSVALAHTLLYKPAELEYGLEIFYGTFTILKAGPAPTFGAVWNDGATWNDSDTWTE